MFSLEIIPYELKFRFLAKTSRGALKTKSTWFVRLCHSDFPNREGWGECGPLPGLSPDFDIDMEKTIREIGQMILPLLETKPMGWHRLTRNWMESKSIPWAPSVLFAIETAWLDWINGGQKLICDPFFHQGHWSIPINGLVWMNERETMFTQALEKAALGFQVIKIKVGALDWVEEWNLLNDLRKKLSPDQFTLRLDANGAWSETEALDKLKELAAFSIHSLEQPIPTGNPEAMERLCRNSPVPIALDESLIGHPFDNQKFSLLEEIQPQYIVLKPTLVGGLGQTDQWIRIAEDLGIDWWITSMLESNLGLNAIAQLAAQYRPTLAQGLGTGGLYENNVEAPLEVHNGQLNYNSTKIWNLCSL